MIYIDPYNYNSEGVVFVNECDCGLTDEGETIGDLEIAMANHICK